MKNALKKWGPASKFISNGKSEEVNAITFSNERKVRVLRRTVLDARNGNCRVMLHDRLVSEGDPKVPFAGDGRICLWDQSALFAECAPKIPLRERSEAGLGAVSATGGLRKDYSSAMLCKSIPGHKLRSSQRILRLSQ